MRLLEMATISFNCNCGFVANNQKQLTKHINRCVNHNDDLTCNKCKHIYATKYNRDRHMKNCNVGEEPIDDYHFINSNDKLIAEIESDLNLIKAFQTNYKLNSASEQQKQLKSPYYNTYKKLIGKYKSCIDSVSNQNDNIANLSQGQPSNAIITNSNNNNSNNQSTNNSHNQTTNNINNQTNNNQVTVNNNNNITVIYPFGFENIYFLSVYEMVDILTSKNCLISAMEKIFSNVENKNFMKRNMNREQMTVIDSQCNIKVMNDDVFKKKIIKNTFSALQLMFYHCKNMLRIEHQIILWQNLRLLDELIRENISLKNEKNMCSDIKQIMDTITNLVAGDNENPEYREKFNEIKNSINNEEYKKLFNEKLNLIAEKMQEFNDDYQTRSLTMDIVRNQIWNRNVDSDPLLSLNNLANHIERNDIETTPRFMFFKDMEIRENDYLQQPSNNTIGNIDSLCNIREKVANGEFKKYQDKFTPSLKDTKVLERKIKNSKKYSARDQMNETKPIILETLAPVVQS